MSADVLRDLARVKAIFQLRAIEAVIRGPAIAIEARSGETTKIGSTRQGESAARRDRPHDGCMNPTSAGGE